MKQLERGKRYKARNDIEIDDFFPGSSYWMSQSYPGGWDDGGVAIAGCFTPASSAYGWDIIRCLTDEADAARAEGALKYDGSKPPLHLIAPDFLYAIAEILDFGAKKYAPRNWEKGMDWSRCYRAAIGHLFDWFMRKGPDPETGKSHLWHAACCIMFLVCYEIRGIGTDDRP